MLGMELSLKISSLCGTWRAKDQPEIIWLLMSSTSILISTTFMVTQLGWIVQSESLADFNERLFLVPQFINSYVKAILMIMQKKKITKLGKMFLQGCCTPRNLQEIAIQRRFDKIIRILSAAGFCLTNVFTAALVLAPQARSTRTLPRNAWLPFDTNTDLRYWMSYSHQILALVLLLNNTVATIWITLGFMHQLSCQFVILRLRFARLPEIVKALTIAKIPRNLVHVVERNFIRESVKNHQYLFRLTKEVNDTFECFMFQQFCLITVLISSNLYKLSIKSDSIVDVYVATYYMITTLIHFCIFSWFTNQVMIESYNFGRSIQMIDWTFLSLDTKKDLIMIIMRASKPNAIKCSFFKFSLETSLNVLKFSYAMWNLFRNVSK